MAKAKKTRVIISKIGLDGHDRGAKVVSALLRDAGMEVIYLGLHQTPESIVRAAIEEDVDVIGLSCLCGEHLTHVPRVIKLLKEKNVSDVLLLIGGVLPREDIPLLKEMGVNEVFLTGSSAESIAEYIKENA